MPAELLAVGTSTTPSADFTVAAGETLGIALKGQTEADGVPYGAKVYLQAKDDDDDYWEVDILTGGENRAMVISAGTYRLVRHSRSAEVGVFSV